MEKILDIDINIKGIDITSNIYIDTKIDEWIIKLPSLNGSKIILNNIIKTPLNNKEILTNRQQCNINLNENDIDILKKYEDNILWLYELQNEFKNNESNKLLFLSGYFLEYLNNYEYFLNLLHIYKIIIIPLFIIISPLSLFFGPYYYLKKITNLTLTDYIKYIIILIKFFFKRTSNIKNDIYKLIIFIIYILLYFYNIYQTYEYTYMLYKTRKNLKKKLNGLSIFINKSLDIINSLNIDDWKPFYIYDKIDYNNLNIKDSLNNIYKLWKNNNLYEDINTILKIIYTIDTVNTITKLKNKENWCIVNYCNETKLWGMENPLLENNQQSNPIDISKNIIITGPNAAGKTTYIKSLSANIILSQTIGICNALKANIQIYDCVKTFMRITDVIGSKSYFEAESEYCFNMIKDAIKLSKENKKGLFILDEPMHSTPPIEGMSIAYAVCEYISKFDNIKLLITTHYHKLILLEDKYPDKFINLYFNALYDDINKKFIFNYKLNKGYSTNCIAIELLDNINFPNDLIKSAIEMKNKICNDFYSR
jgi:predicted ATPase